MPGNRFSPVALFILAYTLSHPSLAAEDLTGLWSGNLLPISEEETASELVDFFDSLVIRKIY
ncbi:hypothetical protein JCM17961_08300 [Endothiovibrio diazotrophicus]